MSELNEKIKAIADTPQSVSVDGQSVATRSLAELIEADRYLASLKVQPNKSAWACLRMVRVQPPRPN